MKDLQYAFGVTLLVYVPITLLTDASVWAAAGTALAVAFGLAILIDWLRSTARPLDPRQRWRR